METQHTKYRGAERQTVPAWSVPAYLTVGGCGGVVAEGGVGGAVVLQGGQLLFPVTRALFRTLEMLPEFHNLLNETEGEREE